MYNIEYFINLLDSSEKANVVSCAAPYDAPTIKALEFFREKGLLKAILVGEENKILAAIEEAGVNKSDYEIINCDDLYITAEVAVKLVSDKKADFLMKALIDTSILLKEFLKKEHGLRKSKVMSHVGVYFKENTDNLYVVTDAGMNIAPTLEEKKLIIENSVGVANAIGIETPNVAMLCAKEKPYDKMPATLDADALQKMNQNGELAGCVVSGPLQLDNAVSMESAKMKGVTDPVAGKADILVCPDIEAGNILAKGLTYLAGYISGGLIIGGQSPVVLTSRSDGFEEKQTALILAMLIDKNN